MVLRLAFVFGVLFGLSATEAQASIFRFGIAEMCGQDPSRPSFSAAEYAEALADTQRDLQQAENIRGRRDRQAEVGRIRGDIERLKKCQDEETRKVYIPVTTDCAHFLSVYETAFPQLVNLHIFDKITDDYFFEGLDLLKARAEDCLRKLTARCFHPTDTAKTDQVIRAVQAARSLGVTLGRRDTLKEFFFGLEPNQFHFVFCTVTDYACKGDQAACDRRIEQIREIMLHYMPI